MSGTEQKVSVRVPTCINRRGMSCYINIRAKCFNKALPRSFHVVESESYYVCVTFTWDVLPIFMLSSLKIIRA